MVSGNLFYKKCYLHEDKNMFIVVKVEIPANFIQVNTASQLILYVLSI